MAPITYDFRPTLDRPDPVSLAAIIAAQRGRGLQSLQNSATPIPPSGDVLTRGIVPVIGGQTDAARMQDMMQQRNYEAATVPYLSGQTSEQRLRAQLAGDVTGDTSQILRSLVHQNPNDISISPQAYTSQSGEGKIDLSAPTKDTLDRNIHNDPTFQALLQKNPDQAKFVYHQLVRRNYDEDVKGAQTYAHSRAQFAQGLIDDNVKEQIKDSRAPEDAAKKYYDFQRSRGATYDPVKKTWRVLNMEETPGELGQPPRLQLKPVDATEEQNAMMMTGHKALGFTTLPNVPDVSLNNPALVQQAQDYEKDPTAKAAIDAGRLAVGRELTPQEKALAVLKQRQNQASYNSGPLHTLDDEIHSPKSTINQTLESMGKGIFGLTGNSPVGSRDVITGDALDYSSKEDLTGLGKFMYNLGSFIQDPGVPSIVTPEEARRQNLKSRGIPLSSINSKYKGDAASDAAHILSLISR